LKKDILSDALSTEGAGFPKSIAFYPKGHAWEKGGTVKQVTDFFRKKNRNKRNLFRRGGPSGTQPPLASYLLVHPNAMHFGTGLAPFC